MKDKVEACGITYPNREFKDFSGCIKPNGHNDAHIFKTNDGRYIEWEDDYSCTCGCWDDWEDYDKQVCLIYSEIKPPNL